ncbi:AsmA family protein [Pseudorhodobacter sp.]|uniref:AsmA family protein n=1 Tax=Pseudorhodobacter sp. TaxID=1934400 RepID=UPI0039E63ED6
MRWVVRIVSGLIMLAVVMLGVVLLIPSRQVAEVAAAQFYKATGRSLTIEGDASPTIWPVLGVKTGRVTISNADWAREGPMLEAQGLAIGVDMASLFGGDLKITKIEAIQPTIILERRKDGVGNWELAVGAGPEPQGNAAAAGPDVRARQITLDYGMIKDGTVLFLDHATGRRVTLRNIAAEARMSDFTGPAVLSLSAVNAGVKLQLDGQVAQFDAFVAGRISDLALAAVIGGSSFRFDGRLGTAPLVAEGALTADLADLAAVAALTGQAVPALPQGLGAATRQVAGQITLTQSGSIHLRGATITLDSNRLAGDMDLTFGGARPLLTAKIAAGALNLAALAGGPATPSGAGGAASQGAAPVAGWSRAPIDVSGLAVMDAAVTLSADSVDLGGARLGRTRLLLSLERARLVIESRELRAYGGTVAGNFVINGRGGLSVGGDLKISGVAMQPLLQDVASFDRLIGTGDIIVRFLGVGNTMAAIMTSLSGAGSLHFGRGELRGLDLLGMLRTLDLGYVGDGQKTIFDAITGTFTLKDGVLRNDDLQLGAPYVSATGAGRVGIGARDLDYRVVASALTKADGSGGVTVPLLITGPWAQPRFRLDMKSFLDQNLADEKALLQEKADAEQARIKAKLEKELGIQQQEGEDLEAAAKRRVQEALEAEAARALRRLLGGN